MSMTPVVIALISATALLVPAAASAQLGDACGHQFLNGRTIPAGPTSNGQLVTYRIAKTGRYLVICMNRVHFLNDRMFGFVNVVGD